MNAATRTSKYNNVVTVAKFIKANVGLMQEAVKLRKPASKATVPSQDLVQVGCWNCRKPAGVLCCLNPTLTNYDQLVKREKPLTLG